MIPVADTAVRWHPAPASPPPVHQSMQDPVAPPVPQRPDLTQLRLQLQAAEAQTAALQERRSLAQEARGRQLWHGPGELIAGVVMTAVGSGFLLMGVLGPGPLGLQLGLGLGGGCVAGAGCTGTCCCLDGQRTDERLVAQDVTDAELTAARASQQERQADFEQAQALDMMMALTAVAGRDVALIALDYAQPLPANDPGAPT